MKCIFGTELRFQQQRQCLHPLVRGPSCVFFLILLFIGKQYRHSPPGFQMDGGGGGGGGSSNVSFCILRTLFTVRGVRLAVPLSKMDADGLEPDHSNEAPWCDLDLFRKVLPYFLL